MKKAVTLFLVFCCISHAMRSQTKLDSLKALGRDSLIKLAVKKINDPNFISTNYDLIRVEANKTTLLVHFELSIHFVGARACHYDAVTIALFGSGTYSSITGDCEHVKFYDPSASDKKSIAFVFAAINKSDEVGHIPDNKLDKGTTMTITEKPTYYYVEVSSYSTYSHYKVDKISGKISEANHKHYAQEHQPANDWVEIK